MNATLQSSDTMAAWLRDNMPNVTVDQMYHGRPIRNPNPTRSSEAEQLEVLRETNRRYADVYAAHRVSAVAYPTVPLVATPIHAGGPQEPLGAILTLNGIAIEEGKAIARNIFMAPRFGAAAMTIPAGLSNGLPVGIQLDTLAGNDSELLGLGIAVERVLGRIPGPPAAPR